MVFDIFISRFLKRRDCFPYAISLSPFFFLTLSLEMIFFYFRRKGYASRFIPFLRVSDASEYTIATFDEY